MLKKILLTTISLLFILSSLDIYASSILAPPNLQNVMKENEKLVKQNLKKKKWQTSTWTVTKKPITYTYQTLIAGDAVRISRYNEVELWVQEVDLSRGATLTSMLTQSGYDSSSWEPLFVKKKISEALVGLDTKPFSLINWQFFDPAREYTPLSFGVKEWATVRTAWADNRDESKNILIIDSTGASLLPYSWENLRDASGSLALVNLTLDESHHRTESIGRTYICLQNMNSQNQSSTLLIFTALAMSETDIEKEFPRWWCSRNAVAKLDASGSSRLWVGGEYIYGKSHQWDPDYRKIPHYLAVWDR